MSSDLDTRLRSAGTSLRAAVEDIEPRPLPSPSPVRRPLLAAAALLVVVALVAAVAALRRDPESNVSTDPDEVPRLVFDESVLGMPATGALELPVEDAMAAPIGVTVYEAPVDEGTAQLAVLTFHVPDGGDVSWEPGEDSEPVTARGTDGWFQQDEISGVSVAWETAPGRVVTVASRQLDREQLLASVEAGTDDGGRIVPGPVAPALGAPDPLGRPGQVDLFSLAPVPAGAVGHGVGYQSEDDPGRIAFLSVVAADEDDITALRWMSSADTPVDVRGHAGWMGTRTFPAGSSSSDSGSGSAGDSGSGAGTPDTVVDEAPEPVESHTVVWEEQPGVVAVLSASGFGADQLLQLAAEGIRVASETEWTALVEASESAAPIGADAAVSGTAGDVAWSVYLDDDGTVCAATQTDSSGVEGCGSTPGGAEILESEDGTPLVVYGAFPEGAVDMQAPDGSQLAASSALSDNGVTVYAIPLDEGPPPTEVVFVDADGNDVGRIQVGFVPAVEAESPAPPGP